jgi:cold shock CspA family protein
MPASPDGNMRFNRMPALLDESLAIGPGVLGWRVGDIPPLRSEVNDKENRGVMPRSDKSAKLASNKFRTQSILQRQSCRQSAAHFIFNTLEYLNVNDRTHGDYVKTWKPDRGFGFCKVTNLQNELDVFFHISDLQKSGIKQVAEGDRLAFNVVQDEKSRRYKAADIKLQVA